MLQYTRPFHRKETIRKTRWISLNKARNKQDDLPYFLAPEIPIRCLYLVKS